MKLPHIKYLETLIAGRLTNQEILKDLQQHSLQVPPSKEVDAIRKTLKLGQEDYFEDMEGKEVADLSWLHETAIEAMFGYRFMIQVAESTDGIDGAFKVLNDRSMYRVITSLAMSGVVPEDIELIVNGKYDIEYSSNDLDQFLHYFFNLEGWSYFEKDEYSSGVKDEQLRMYYNMALEEEKDYLMWKLGIAPNKSFDAMLRDMAFDCYYNFKEQSTRNPEHAHKWGQLALKVQERLEKVEKDLEAESDMHQDLQFYFIGKDKMSDIPEPKTEKPSKEPLSDKQKRDPFEDIKPIAAKHSPAIVRPEDLN